MSTTSTTFNDYKSNVKNSTSRGNARNQASYAEPFRTRQKIDKDIRLKKSSNERVLDDLSTFIAECSYLTDGQDPKPETSKSPIRSYNAKLVQSSDNNESFFIKKGNRRPYQNSYRRPKGYVEWIDQRRPYPDHSTIVKFPNETTVETREVGRPYVSRERTDSDYILEQIKRKPPEKKVQKHEDFNIYKRSRSSSKRRDDKKPIRLRVESNEVNRKLSYQKVRRRKSKSAVRYWPFRYEKKKTKYRIKKLPLVRKKTVIPWERKVGISSDSPTVITLYPENERRKQSQGKIDEIDFLANPDLTCKCFKCMRKYELLQQISNDEPNTIYYTSKNQFKSVAVGNDDIVSHPKEPQKPEKCPCKKTGISTHIPHPRDFNQTENNSFGPKALQFTSACKNLLCCNTPKQRNHANFFNNSCECRKNLVYYSMPQTNQQLCLPKQIVGDCCRPCQFYEPYPNLRCHEIKPCPYPCDDERLVSDWNLNEIGSCDEQIGGTSYKSVYFRFDCVGHQIDPAVTQYFHSILNNRIH